MPSALIVGASRGLGLEFLRQYRAERWEVWGTVRAPADADTLRDLGARPIELDVRDVDAGSRLAAALGDEVLDLAVVNAGVHGPRGVGILQPPSAPDFDLVLHTNVLGPMRLMPTLAPRLRAPGGTLVFVTSRMGSVASAGAPHGLLYRVSKAAENMLAKMAHVELCAQGVRVVALNPGWVRTDMGGPGAAIEPEASIAGMRRVIADPVAWPGGGFYDYSGETIAW